MKALKIGGACFAGGVALCAVALLVAPMFWWLGIVAGSAVGYLAYEFGDVMRATPKAFAVAREGAGNIFDSIVYGLVDWVKKEHPIFYPSFICGCGAFACFYFNFATEQSLIKNGGWEGFFASFFCIAIFTGIVWIFLFLFASIGAVSEGKIFEGIRATEDCTFESLAYRNAYRWMLKGLWVFVRFLIWDAWVAVVKFVATFVVTLIKLIHSNERVLCSVDGTLGGLVSLWVFWTWFSSDNSVTTGVFVTLCGGAIGAAFGILKWELVSKRIFGYGLDVPSSK